VRLSFSCLGLLVHRINHSAFVGLSQKIGRCLPKAKRKPERYNNLIFRGKGREQLHVCTASRISSFIPIYHDFGVNMLHSSTGRRDWGAFVQYPRNSYCGDPGEIRREEISALWKEVSLPGTILACNAKSSLPSPCYSHKAFSVSATMDLSHSLRTWLMALSSYSYIMKWRITIHPLSTRQVVLRGQVSVNYWHNRLSSSI